MNFSRFLNYKIFNNSINKYLICLSIIILGYYLLKFFKKIFLKKIHNFVNKTESKIDDFVLKFFESTIIPIIYYGIFYLAIQALILNSALKKMFNVIGIILITVYGIKFILQLVKYIVRFFWIKESNNKSKEKSIQGFLRIINVLTWVAGITFLLDNLGFKISTVIAGLGISGIAVALAAQAILGDLFSYFAILIDKPFEIGDFIIIDDFLGVVEEIGIKTSRLRSLSGEQLIFSNKDLTSSRLKNYKRMAQRRVVFDFGIIYKTPLEKTKKIPDIIKEIIENISETRFDRAHFASFGNFSLNFEVVYYVLNSDYNKYMDIQQEINHKIYEYFNNNNIEFAYPTQEIFVNKKD